MKELFRNASQSVRENNPHLWPVSDIKRAARGFTERKRGIMNKTERDYSLILAAQLVKGEISGWMYEGVKLKIGESCFYAPDFMVWKNLSGIGISAEKAPAEIPSMRTADNTSEVSIAGYGNSAPSAQIKFIEIKGFLRDDARVKFLAAQEQHKWATFEMWRKDKKMGWTQIL